VVASKRIDAEAEHGRGVAWVFFAGEGVDKAAAGGLVGLAADDEGSDLVGIALQESDELGAMERDGAGLTTLGDLKTAEQGGAGWIRLGVVDGQGAMGGCVLPVEAVLCPVILGLSGEAIDGEGGIWDEGSVAKF
jgi:hypothetical protein